jgi:hypothetical protein
MKNKPQEADLEDFVFASGSVMGSYHKSIDKNNQDSRILIRRHNYAIGIVTDGCGSSDHSEVGARLGADMIAANITNSVNTPSYTEKPNQWISGIIYNCCMDLYAFYESYDIDETDLLFTVVGFVLTPTYSHFFCYGDGLVFIDGNWDIITSPGNYPEYPIYRVLKAKDAEPQFFRTVPTKGLYSFAVGTDGLNDLKLASVKEKVYPGTTNPVESWSDLLFDPQNFDQKSCLQNKLQKLNAHKITLDREKGRINKHPGLLSDDTTVIVGSNIINLAPEEETSADGIC